MTDESRTIVFADDDGFEVLVTLWPEKIVAIRQTALSASFLARPGKVEVALRPPAGPNDWGPRVWGPPLREVTK